MADFDDIDQVIKFVTQLDQQSVQKLTQELNKINSDRVEAVSSSEGKIVDAQIKAAAQRMELAAKELTELERQLVVKTDRELDQIKRIMDANEDRYKFVVTKAKEAAQAQQELTKALTSQELQSYQQYLQNRDVLHKRQSDVEKEREKESAGNAWQDTKGARSMVGGAVSFVTGMMPSANEQEKQTKLLGETAANVLQSKTPVEALLNVVKGGLQMWDLHIKEDARRGEAMMDAMGGTTLWRAGGAAHEALKSAMSTLEKSGIGMTDRHIAEIPKVLAEITKSNEAALGHVKDRATGKETGFIPKLGSVSDEYDATSKLMQQFQDLRSVADLLGENWSSFAKTTGDLARKEQETMEQALGDIALAVAQAQAIRMDDSLKSSISIQKFVDSVLNGQEALRPFGFTVQDTTKLVTKFAKELDSGIISLNELVQWATGITKTEDSSKAFLFQQMQQMLTDRREFQDLNRVIQAVGKDPRQQSFALEALSQGNTKQLELLGISAKEAQQAVAQFRGGVQETLTRWSGSQAGGAGGFAQAANVDFFRRQFVDPALVGMPTQGMTIQQRQMMRERGFADQQLISGQFAAEMLDSQISVQEAAMYKIHRDQGGLFGRAFGGLSMDRLGQQRTMAADYIPGANPFPYLGQMGPPTGGAAVVDQVNRSYPALSAGQLVNSSTLEGGQSTGVTHSTRAAQFDVNVNVGGDLDSSKFREGMKAAVDGFVREYLKTEQEDPHTRALKNLSADYNVQTGMPARH